jgi:hypothetical protein
VATLEMAGAGGLGSINYKNKKLWVNLKFFKFKKLKVFFFIFILLQNYFVTRIKYHGRKVKVSKRMQR